MLKTNFVVVGAGMAGLLAGSMLRNNLVSIYEKQESLPNNHSAVLRFRSSVVGDTLNIPFRKVKVIKAIEPFKNPVAQALAYSKKTNGSYRIRSSVSADGELCDRWIAPNNFIQQMNDLVNERILFGQDFFTQKEVAFAEGVKFISTIPMPSLMKILEYPGEKKIQFMNVKGVNIEAVIGNCDAHCSLYVPNPLLPFSRVSITGSRLTVECQHKKELLEDHKYAEAVLRQATTLLGFTDLEDLIHWQVKEQRYAKILPIDDDERKRFILWATEEFGIYSLGRFATWRPGLLLDDVVNDVRIIQKLAGTKHAYDHKKG